MSKKDFEAIAAILAGDLATATPAEFGKVFNLTLSLADYFAQSNPRFRRDLFYAAAFGTADHFAARDKGTSPYVKCENCGQYADTLSPCAPCNATRAMSDHRI